MTFRWYLQVNLTIFDKLNNLHVDEKLICFSVAEEPVIEFHGALVFELLARGPTNENLQERPYENIWHRESRSTLMCCIQ